MEKEYYTPIQGTLCYLFCNGKVLFIHRGEGLEDIHNGFFVPPGGTTMAIRERSFFERGIDCAKREIKEETGLMVRNPRLRAIVTFNNLGRSLGLKVDPPDWKVEVYEATEYTGELIAEEGKKNSKPVWVREDQIGEVNMSAGDRELYEFLRKNKEGVFEIAIKYRTENELDYFRVAKVA